MTNEKIIRIILIGYGLLWFGILSYKFYSFSYYDWDLAFFSQAMYCLLNGSQYVSLTGINYFGDHSYYISLFLLPIFAIAPHPLTLLAVKIVAFVVSAYILYRLIRQDLGEGPAFALTILYLLFPANLFSLLYEYNPENLAPVFLVAMFYFFRRRNLKGFAVAALFLMLIKENMPLIVAAFGIFALFVKDRDRRWWGIAVLGTGLGLFYILSFHITPMFREIGHHAFVVRYQHLGGGLPEILGGLLNPAKLVPMIFRPTNVNYIVDLFSGLLLPAWLSPHILFLISPILLQHLLSDHAPEHTIFYHYGLTMTPVIFLAAVTTLKALKPRLGSWGIRILIVLCALWVAKDIWHNRAELAIRMDFHQDDLTASRAVMLAEVPPDVPVVATFDYLSALSMRRELYAFHKIYFSMYQDERLIKKSELNTGKRFVLPEYVRYALIDFGDAWISVSYDLEPVATRERIDNFLKDWEPVKRKGRIVLYRRK